MATTLSHQSFNADQLEQRRKTLGASEIPVVCGLVPQKSPISLWLEKRGLVPAFAGNEFTEWGNRLETIVAEKYAEVRGVEIFRSDTVIHSVDDWMSATPDRLVDGSGGVIDRGLEVKCRGEYRGSDWGEPGTDEVPHDVAIQCHWSMIVTGLPRWDVATLIGGNKFRMYELYADTDIARDLIAIGREFWFDYVLAGVQPPIDGSEATTAILAKRFSRQTEVLRAATQDEAQWLASLKDVVEEKKALEAAENELKNRLRNAIGEDVGIQCPDGSKITWKRPKNSIETDYEALVKSLDVPSTTVLKFTSEKVNSRRLVAFYPKER